MVVGRGQSLKVLGPAVLKNVCVFFFFFLMRTVGGDMKILEAKVLVAQATKF